MKVMTVEEISVIIAALSAFAAAVSAVWSYRSVSLSHRPFVVGEDHREATELNIEPDAPELGVVGVLLRNEGPGVALKISYRVKAWTAGIDTSWTPSIGSLPPGAERTSSVPFTVPAGVTDVELFKAEPPVGSPEPNYVLWYVETEFSDIRGVTWTVRPKGAFGSAEAPRRVRSRKLDIWRPRGSAHMPSIWWMDAREALLERKQKILNRLKR